MINFRSIAIGSLVLVAFAASTGQADQLIPVVEASPGVSRQVEAAQENLNTAKSSYSGVSANAQDLQFYDQLESLQREVQQLRGIVEEQGHQIKQMREGQLDRYRDLDRRIGIMNSADPKPDSASEQKTPDKPPVAKSTAEPKAEPKAETKPKPAMVVAAPDKPDADFDKAAEKEAYEAAFQLVRNKQYPQAVDAFNQQIKTYPDGNYTANAYYWLGEVLLVESKPELALNAFGSLLSHYPEHRKAPDAKYKQGKTYLQLGNKTRAKELLQSVIDQYPGTSAAKLAEADLRDAQL